MGVRRLIGVAALVLVVGAQNDASAQPGGGALGAGITFNSGQSVQPIFEGWTKNADGSFELHFGYFNRNYVETPSVPLGPNNSFEPGAADWGQPAFFYPRYNRRAFSVTVPKDFGKKEVTWKLTTNGKTEQAVGWLQTEWEIEPAAPGVGGGQSAAPPARQPTKNEPPKISVANPGPAAVGSRLTLTSSVTDDGPAAGAQAMGRGRGGAGRGAGTAAPGGPAATGGTAAPGGAGASAAAAGGRGAGRAPAGPPPTFRRDSPATTPTNVPQLEQAPRPRVGGLSVAWLTWRGPAAVAFDPPAVAVKDGTAVVSATFKSPGEYVLRARASDGSAVTEQDVKVVVSDTAR